MNKARLRAMQKARLSSFSEAKRREQSDMICEMILQSPQYLQADAVLSYSPIQWECDISRVNADAARRSVLYLPRVDGGMAFYRVEDPSQLSKGAYGILEPSPAGDAFHTARRVTALVPGLAFTCSGARLGRGAGYYDNFFSSIKCEVYKLGIALSANIVDNIPMETNDIFMDSVITCREREDT